LAENNFTTLLSEEAFERCYPPQILNGSLTSPIQIALGSFLLLNKTQLCGFPLETLNFIRNVSDSAETYFFYSNHLFL